MAEKQTPQIPRVATEQHSTAAVERLNLVCSERANLTGTHKKRGFVHHHRRRRRHRGCGYGDGHRCHGSGCCRCCCNATAVCVADCLSSRALVVVGGQHLEWMALLERFDNVGDWTTNSVVVVQVGPFVAAPSPNPRR